MILSDREIHMAIERGLIGIVPRPTWRSKAWSSTALDLHLDGEIRPWNPIEGTRPATLIDPVRKGFNTNTLIARHTEQHDCGQGFVIGPRHFVLGWTIEKLRLPHTSRLAARVEGKSSLARIGLGVHVTAPTIHAGFGVNEAKRTYIGSPIRLEIWNAGPLEIVLTKGMPICQLIFEEVHGTPEAGYSGLYAVQGPEPKKGRPPGSKRKATGSK
jgi:dCTP deaminase